MERSQENFLYSYLKQTKISFFSFTKSENRKMEQVLQGCGGRHVNSEGWEELGKWRGRVNIV
jgi:hypothetical protein